jgi:thiamine kinase-like enzyme
VELVRRIAEAVHKIHRADVPAEHRHTMADELRILHKRLPEVARQEPAWERRIERLLAACDRLGESVPEPRACGVHRDFYADQVLVSGQRLVLLDFDLYCVGDPALDVGNFLGHVTAEIRDGTLYFSPKLNDRLDGLSLPMRFRKTSVEATLKEGKLTVTTQTDGLDPSIKVGVGDELGRGQNATRGRRAQGYASLKTPSRPGSASVRC